MATFEGADGQLYFDRAVWQAAQREYLHKVRAAEKAEAMREALADGDPALVSAVLAGDSVRTCWSCLCHRLFPEQFGECTWHSHPWCDALDGEE